MAQVMAGATYNEMLDAFAEMAALESLCKACALLVSIGRLCRPYWLSAKKAVYAHVDLLTRPLTKRVCWSTGAVPGGARLVRGGRGR
jgi:hypothetical protein